MRHTVCINKIRNKGARWGGHVTADRNVAGECSSPMSSCRFRWIRKMAVAPSKTPTLMEPIASKMLFPVIHEAYVAMAVSTQDHCQHGPGGEQGALCLAMTRSTLCTNMVRGKAAGLAMGSEWITTVTSTIMATSKT